MGIYPYNINRVINSRSWITAPRFHRNGDRFIRMSKYPYFKEDAPLCTSRFLHSVSMQGAVKIVFKSKF